MSRRLAVSSLLVVLAAVAPAFPAGAAAEPRVSATPNPVPFGKTLVVKGRGWPVIEFCSRTVRLSLRSDQNAFRIGTDRVGPRGRFRFTWVPRRDEVGRGDWTLVARMRCESGQDGSPNPIRATAPIRIGGSNLVVERGRQEARLLPSPPVLGFHGRFWIAPFAGECTVVSGRALDAAGKELKRIEIPPAPPPKPGYPSPQPDKDCPV